jgi:glycopeptide antibiotics resistance protein
MRVAKVPLWGWWSLVVVVVSLPWIGCTTTPQWNRVHAVPFTDPEDSPRDLVVNVALFVPFGFLFGTRRHGAPAMVQAALAAAAVSVFAEAPQLFSTKRNPSGTDVFYAMAGAAAGAALRRGVTRLAPPRGTP